jgi:polyhydroxybutyrate depolymerase
MRHTSSAPIKTWLKRSALVFLALLGVFICGVFAWASFADRQALSDLPEGSRLVDIGGQKVHLHGMGLDNPGPAIVLLPGQPGDASPDSGWWIAVQSELAKTRRVYAVDEPGYAWSDAGPGPFSHRQSADALGQALALIGEDPVILVSFANGNLTALDMVHLPSGKPHVLGMLWIDPDELTASRAARLEKRYAELHVNDSVPLLRLLTDLGIGRLALYGEWIAKEDASLLEEMLPDAARESFDWAYYDKVNATRGSRKALKATFERATTYVSDLIYTSSLPRPADMPIFILQTDLLRERKTLSQAAIAMIPEQTRWYQQVAGDISGGRYIHVPGSSHLIVIERPWEVIQAINKLIDSVNRGGG